jgi:hypothetical protein
MIDWSEVNRKNYESVLFNTSCWSNTAHKLYISASLFEPHILKFWESCIAHSKGEGSIRPDYHMSVYFMLIAYAIENILKAIIISKYNTVLKNQFEKNRKFPKELKSHDLVSLCKKAEVTISLSEENLLRRLSRSATWYGRYPAPLNIIDFRGIDKFTNGDEFNIGGFGADDVEMVGVLMKELFSFIK